MLSLPWRTHLQRKMMPMTIKHLIDRYHQALVAEPFDGNVCQQLADELRTQVMAKSRDSRPYLAWLGRHSVALFEARSHAPGAVEMLNFLQALEELDWLEQAQERALGERRRSN